MADDECPVSTTTTSVVKNGSAKSNSSAGIIKDRKSPEETIFSLRCELRTLYDSLSDKNEQLLLAERDIRDRDISIRFLKSEFKKLLEQQKKDAATVKALKMQQSLPPQTLSTNGSADAGSATKKSSHEVVEEHLRGKEVTEKLQREIKERDSVIQELNEKVIKLSEDVSTLQEDLNHKSDRVVSLQNEIDKFRQVVRPLTRHMIETKRRAGGLELEVPSAGVESSRLLPVANCTGELPRMKRTAISAEPLSMIAGMEEDLIKIPKSAL